MRSGLSTLGLAAALAVAGSLLGPEARAQNTYADFPYQQGSLFYRPSGARPPRTYSSARPRRRQVYRPAPPGYTVYPSYAVPPRRRVYWYYPQPARRR